MKYRSGITALTLFFFCFVCPWKISAQSTPADSLLYQQALNNVVQLYHRTLGDQSGLYNGTQYVSYPFPFRDGKHPFFYSDNFSNGSIVYDNVLYPNILLLYDEAGDFLALKEASRRIKLINDRIQEFTLFNNRFVRIVKDSQNLSLPATGFYNILYDGKLRVLKKEVKTINEVVVSSSEGIVRFINSKSYYYIKKENVYYPVTKKKSLIAIYKDHKNEIQQYIRRNNLSYKGDKDGFLTSVSAYYDQLTK